MTMTFEEWLEDYNKLPKKRRYFRPKEKRGFKKSIRKIFREDTPEKIEEMLKLNDKIKKVLGKKYKSKWDKAIEIRIEKQKSYCDLCRWMAWIDD